MLYAHMRACESPQARAEQTRRKWNDYLAVIAALQRKRREEQQKKN